MAIMKKDRSRLLIPCYRDMDAYDIPGELSGFQSQDMSKIGFIQDILRGVKKVLAGGNTTRTTTTAAPGVESLMKRGWLFLEDGDWKQADEYLDKVLDIDPEYAPAYVGKLCAELKVKQEELLAHQTIPLNRNKHFEKALRFASADYRVKLEKYNEETKQRFEEMRGRLEVEEAEKQERLRLEQERLRAEEAEKQERLRLEQERLKVEQEHLRLKEQERLEKEQEEQERLEQERREEQQKRFKSELKQLKLTKERQAELKREYKAMQREEQRKQWQSQCLCINCGGKFGGIFTKKCKSCGKEQ